MAQKEITRSIIIKGSPDELYHLWSDYDKHPMFSDSLKKVESIDDRTTRWVMDGPLGKDFEWTAELTRDEPNHRIAWRTLEGDVKTSGQITFTPLEKNETQMVVHMQYVPPAGKLGEIGAKVLANPEKRVEKDLKEFKDYVEKMTGKNVKSAY